MDIKDYEVGDDTKNPKYKEVFAVRPLADDVTANVASECGMDEECDDPSYEDPYVVPPLPTNSGGGGGGGTGEGHSYTFGSTATGWQVREDGRVIFTYTDKNDNTTYTWQATTEGWLVKDNKGNTVFTYTDKKGTDTTYSFEETDNCGIKVTDSTGKVVFNYANNCGGTSYTFEQEGSNFKVTNNNTGAVVFNYTGATDTNTTYNFEDYKDGFKVTDSEGVVAYTYDPEMGKNSDGAYPITSLLTTAFMGHTTIATGQITGFTPSDLVVGETLLYDSAGSVGVVTADNGDGTYQVTTMTTSPGSRQGVRLGSVATVDALPATCTAAEALGWQTPQLGDFAYVTAGGAGDVVSEYVITTDTDCNLTWTFSHSFNAGDYQEQSTTSMAGMLLTGGAVQGTFGEPIDPSTFIKGVQRNGVDLTPDANGKVNVIVDASHIIVNALPTSGIVDLAEYIVIDADKNVTGTWVHDSNGWYQTYAPVINVKAHQIVSALPTTGIEENVEYIIVDDSGKLSETWVYDPTLGWVQTEVLDKPSHIIVKDLPTTKIDDDAEYVQVTDLDDPVNTYVASWVHTDDGWIKVAEPHTITAAHIAVTALPTTNINENAEYLVMTDTSDPSTLTGTFVRVNGNWVQTEKMENGFHIVTSLPTSNIDNKNEYIVVEDLTKPDETLIGHYAYDSSASKWIDLNSKYEVNRGVSLNGYVTSAEDFQDMPVGAVAPFFGKTAPAHYLICDGTTYNIGTYPELEAFIIEEYGNVNKFGGNGTATWAVPDLRGEFLRGAGTNSHDNTRLQTKEGSGAAVGAHQQSTSLRVIAPSVTASNSIIRYTDNIQSGDYDAQLEENRYIRLTGQEALETGSPSIVSTRPTNTSVNWIIKAESTYAIVPNTDNKVTIKFDTITPIPGNPSVASVVNVTAKQDDTSLWNNAGYFVAPMDGYYDLSVFVSNATTSTANQTRISIWLLSELPATSAWSDMKDHAYAMNQTGDMATQPSVLPVSTSGNVRLNKGDKVYVVLANSWLTNVVGHASMVMTAPISRTEVSRAELMMKPNLWPAGVEQSFGDGVYGYRLQLTDAEIQATKLVPPPVGVEAVYQFKTNIPAAMILSQGGTWFRDTRWYIAIGGYLNQSIGSSFGVVSGNIAISLVDNAATASPLTLDGWVLYSK